MCRQFTRRDGSTRYASPRTRTPDSLRLWRSPAARSAKGRSRCSSRSSRSGGTVPLFVCLKTARGRLELLPGGSGSKGFRFAGMRSVVSVETHSTPKMVGGEARQATVTLSAPTAGGTCPLQVAGIPRAIQVAGAPAPAPSPPPRPAAPPVTPAPAPPPQPAAPPETPAQPRMVTSGAVWSEGAASGVMVRCPEGVGVGQTLMFESTPSRAENSRSSCPPGFLRGRDRVPLPS